MPCCRNRRVSVRTVAGWVCGFLRALSRRPVGKEDEGPDHFVAPLRLVDQLELELREVVGWHPRGSPAPGIRAGDV